MWVLALYLGWALLTLIVSRYSVFYGALLLGIQLGSLLTLGVVSTLHDNAEMKRNFPVPWEPPRDEDDED